MSPKKSTFNKPTDDSQLAQLMKHIGTTDEQELRRIVWLQAFRFGNLDDTLIRFGVEHLDLHDRSCDIERYRWPRRAEARLNLLRLIFSARDFDSPAHCETILKFQREQWEANVTDGTWPDELTQLIRSRPTLHD